MMNGAQHALNCQQTPNVPCAKLKWISLRSHSRPTVETSKPNMQYVKRVKSVVLVLRIPPDTTVAIANAFVDTYSSNNDNFDTTEMEDVRELVIVAALVRSHR